MLEFPFKQRRQFPRHPKTILAYVGRCPSRVVTARQVLADRPWQIYIDLPSLVHTDIKHPRSSAETLRQIPCVAEMYPKWMWPELPSSEWEPPEEKLPGVGVNQSCTYTLKWLVKVGVVAGTVHYVSKSIMNFLYMSQILFEMAQISLVRTPNFLDKIE